MPTVANPEQLAVLEPKVKMERLDRMVVMVALVEREVMAVWEVLEPTAETVELVVEVGLAVAEEPEVTVELVVLVEPVVWAEMEEQVVRVVTELISRYRSPEFLEPVELILLELAVQAELADSREKAVKLKVEYWWQVDQIMDPYLVQNYTMSTIKNGHQPTI